MCGIFGYSGIQRSVPVVVGQALRKLEYRGYDSWGMAWSVPNRLEIAKHVGRVPSQFDFMAQSHLAIGHTRWATHGAVTNYNAHPHLDTTQRVAVVHNGIIENADELRTHVDPTTRFLSETDSEVVAHLLGQRVANGASIVEALCDVFPHITGQNAIIAIDRDNDVIAAAMNVSSLVAGTGPEGSFIASDPAALVGKAASMIVVPPLVVLEIGPDNISAVTFDGNPAALPSAQPVPSDYVDDLGVFHHYMAKEMAEQSRVLQRQIDDPHASKQFGTLLASANTIVLTGCGSALHAARIGAAWLRHVAQKRVIVVPSSDFAEAEPFLGKESVVVAVSQSGETADVLDAVRTAQATQSVVCALVNVEYSSLARMSDTVVPLLASRERSVLATKSMTAMLGRFLLAAGWTTGCPEPSETALHHCVEALDSTLLRNDIRDFANRVSSRVAANEHIFVIGKGAGLGVAQEAALKIKEASYVHAEAFSAGELKHGALALVESGAPCLVCTADTHESIDLDSTSQELRSRGAYTYGIGVGSGSGICDGLVLPDLGSATAIAQVIVGQHIAYETAVLRHVDPDFPRNLAKSVTVR